MEGIMASDISLAAGDGARRMTYTELATVRGTSQLVEMPPSQMAPDDRGLVRGLENAIKALQEQLQFANTALIAERQRVDEFLHQLADAPERAPGADPMTAIGIQTLSQAVEMLRQDVERERSRADRAEREVEEGRKRIDELQASLAEERRRINGLYTDLADAPTAAIISGADAAALRTQLALLTERRPWWWQWFR
jgi:chromosome segregation ATPase